jgi:hypothetical protein
LSQRQDLNKSTKEKLKKDAEETEKKFEKLLNNNRTKKLIE